MVEGWDCEMVVRCGGSGRGSRCSTLLCCAVLYSALQVVVLSTVSLLVAAGLLVLGSLLIQHSRTVSQAEKQLELLSYQPTSQSELLIIFPQLLDCSNAILA